MYVKFGQRNFDGFSARDAARVQTKWVRGTVSKAAGLRPRLRGISYARHPD